MTITIGTRVRVTATCAHRAQAGTVTAVVPGPGSPVRGCRPRTLGTLVLGGRTGNHHQRKDCGMKATHPKCGKTFSGAQSVGHCASCCETFVGLGAFDKHMSRAADGKYHHRDPIEAEKWWLDDRGYWHHGPKLTEEQKAKMWPKEDEE